MDSAFLIINSKNPKNINLNNLFLDKANAIKQINILNQNIYEKNLIYLNEKIQRCNKQFKRDKIKLIINLYTEIYNKCIIATKQQLPLYITPSFKYNHMLKYPEFFLTNLNLQKVIQSPDQQPICSDVEQ